MFNLITIFFKNRTVKVKGSNKLSKRLFKLQENEVLQGSALSITLFIVAITKINKHFDFLIKFNICLFHSLLC